MEVKIDELLGAKNDIKQVMKDIVKEIDKLYANSSVITLVSTIDCPRRSNLNPMAVKCDITAPEPRALRLPVSIYLPYYTERSDGLIEPAGSQNDHGPYPR